MKQFLSLTVLSNSVDSKNFENEKLEKVKSLQCLHYQPINQPQVIYLFSNTNQFIYEFYYR